MQHVAIGLEVLCVTLEAIPALFLEIKGTAHFLCSACPTEFP